jgi:FAD dependent oxidoreductase TIGR03364
MSAKHFDLIVVGSGVLGTFHALSAAGKGLTVLLTEKDSYPINATVRNFGQVVPSGMPSQWFDFGKRSTAIYKAIQSEFDVSVRNNGSIYVASDDQEQQLIHELKQIMDARGYEAQLLTRSQCLKKWPALNDAYCKEGLYFPTEISVEPELMIYKVLEYATAKFPNLTYKPSCPVIDCFSENTGVRVVAANMETFSAEKVIICNGVEFKLLFADLFKKSGIVVSKLQMLRTLPMPAVKLEGNILTGLTIRRYESFEECPSFTTASVPEHLTELKKWGIHILFKKAIDESIIIGDSHEYADVPKVDDLGFTTNHYINELMLKEAQRIVDFDVRQIASSWSGFYPQHITKGIVEIDIENKIHIRTAIGGKGMTSGAGYAEASIARLFALS